MKVAGLNNGGLVFMIGFFSLHLMPVWIYLFGAIFSVLEYRHTEYVITDKGVYLSRGTFSQIFEHKPFAELSHVNINRGIIDQMLNVGDVIFTSNQTDGSRHYGSISICDISDYREVYKTAKQLQENVYSDTMFPNRLRPDANN